MMKNNILDVQTSICSISSHQTYSFHQYRSSYSSHYSNLKFEYQNFQWIVYFIYKKKEDQLKYNNNITKMSLDYRWDYNSHNHCKIDGNQN